VEFTFVTCLPASLAVSPFADRSVVGLKGLGQAILGNFSTDQTVIELTEISQKRLKTIEDLKQNTGKPRRNMDGQNWRGLKWIPFR